MARKWTIADFIPLCNALWEIPAYGPTLVIRRPVRVYRHRKSGLLFVNRIDDEGMDWLPMHHVIERELILPAGGLPA